MAKIDMRENRAEMPERRNVLRKVISPAVAEVAVEIRTEMPEVHYLKARDKQNIEKELRLSDEQKEKEKQQVDAWYDYCEQMLKAELEKRCEIRNY